MHAFVVLVVSLFCLSKGQANTKGVCGDGKIGGIERCDDGNTRSGDGCSASCQVEVGFTCGAPGRLCCSGEHLVSDMGLFCWNGFWKHESGLIRLGEQNSKRSDWTPPAATQITSDLSLCGQVQLSGPLEIVSGTLTISGTLLIASGGVLSFSTENPYEHGQVVITNSCEAPGVDGSNNAELLMDEGAMIRVLGFKWTNEDLVRGGRPYQTFITVGQCARTSSGTFRLEAPIIPSGSNTFPFISSGCQVVNSPEQPFKEVQLDLDGGCSNVAFYHQSNGTWGDVWLTINRKGTCTGTIVALCIVLPAGAALVLLVLFAAVGGLGGAGGDDYVGL